MHDDSLLLCRNRKHGHSFLPGGHVDFGEPAREALEREVREELGVDLVAGKFLGAMEASFIQRGGAKSPSERRRHEVNLVFRLSPSSSHPEFEPGNVRSQEKHIEFVWAPLASLVSEAAATQVLPAGILELITACSQSGRSDAAENWRTCWR